MMKCLVYINNKLKIKHRNKSIIIERQRWRGGLERWPRKRLVGCLNPNRDRTKSQKQVVRAPLLKCDYHGSSEMTIINRCSVSQ